MIRVDDITAAIGRTIIDDEKLEIAKILIEDTFDRRSDVLDAIVNRQENADQR